MPIDPNIIGSHVPPVERFSPLKAIKEARTYAEDQQKARDDQAKREDEAVVQAIMQQHPEDPDTAIKVMKQRGFTRAAMGFQALVTGERTKQAELDTKELSNRRSEATLLKDSIGDGSPGAWNMTVAKLRGKSPELDKILSQPYTPELAKQVQNFATTEKDRSDAVAAAIKSKSLADWMKAFAIDPESQETQQAWAFYMGPEEMSKALVAQQNADTARQQADTNRAEELRLGQPKPGEPFTLGQGQKRFDAEGKEIASVAPRPFAPQRPAAAAGGQGTPSANMPPQARAVLSRILTGMPGTRTGTIAQEVNRLATAGDEERLKSYLRYAATQKVGEARQTAIAGRIETLAALKDAETLLKSVPTNMVRGTWEDTMRALGTTSNPQYVELGARMGTILANYMRSISGAAVSDNEATRLTPLIPNFRNTLPVNLGVMKGFTEAVKSFDKAFYQQTFGEDYDWVMSPSASTAAAKPDTSGIPEGKVQTFPNGKKAVRRNGEWHEIQ